MYPTFRKRSFGVGREGMAVKSADEGGGGVKEKETGNSIFYVFVTSDTYEIIYKPQ